MFRDKITIVTGGASGIGRALCQELGRRGATVVVADINARGAGQVASAIAQARAAHLDVTQAEDVKELVQETASQHGRLDYMFNNAGMAIIGDTRDMDLAHWQRILDVNLWGVIHGTTAAYQVMSQQGFGHIVNTASAAGLVPIPMLVAYTTTKHAVVGLSTSLRVEAAELGVKVNVVCPGLIGTNMPETATYLKFGLEELVSRLPSFNMMDPERWMRPADCARVILRGVERNKAIITVTALARLLWWLNRLHPSLPLPFTRKSVELFRAARDKA